MPIEARVPFASVGRRIERTRADLDAATRRVLDSASLILGDEGASFEREFALVGGRGYAVGVASGTDALEIGLRALGVAPGDEVVTQANTCIPTVSAIARVGAEPVLCDVDLQAGTMDAESLGTALSSRARAVIPVHLYGQCAEMQSILEVARAAGLPVIEDCAHALGATSRLAAAGSHDAAGAFSFYPTKNLGAVGDAGALVTDDGDLARRARELRHHGQRGDGISVHRGANSRLDELQAAVLRARLPRLEAENERRRAIALEYDEALQDGECRPLARWPGHVHVFHLYVVRAPRRDAFIDELRRLGVETMIHYAVPVHHHPAYASSFRRGVTLRNAERLCREVVSLPLYPELTDGEVEHVAAAVRAAARA